MRLGASVLPGGGVRFAVWAPRPRRLELLLGERRIPLERGPDGVAEIVVPEAGAGTDYFYLVDGERRPDPRSRHQPAGVHGPSRVVDPRAFVWRHPRVPMPLADLILYELHVGTFTPAGTFAGVAEKLEHLVALGVNAVELMPVAAFPGRRNWGYDGVALYAVQDSYGGPAGLAALVDACHGAGLAVILDVVYNHLGPEGNYLGELGPYFSDRYRTPWGPALNYDDADCDEVRRFVIDNARMWIEEYQIDGLRLDAVHGIFDQGARHVLEELATEVHGLGPVHLIAESDLNAPHVLRDAAHGGWGMDAQWSDDFHHAAHAALTGDRNGYFADFAGTEALATALERGFVYQGQRSGFRRRRHGAPLGGLGPERLVVCTQNHDQIANASQGRRLGQRVSPALERAAAILVATVPNLPMLFQGQEMGARTPFHYFTDHGDPGLAEAVSRGRREEHAAFGGDQPFCDPQDEKTFARSRLDWGCLGEPDHAALLELYRDALALRRHPALRAGTSVRAGAGPAWLRVVRASGERLGLIVVNFAVADAAIPIDPPARPLRLALGSDAGADVPPVLTQATTLTCPAQCALVYLDEVSP